MSNRNQRHVTRRPDGDWQVIRPNTSRASAVEPTQSAAIDRAREILENDGGGELVIHGRDGKIRDSDTIRFRLAIAHSPVTELRRQSSDG